VSPDALQQVRDFVADRYGNAYLPERAVAYTSKRAPRTPRSDPADVDGQHARCGGASPLQGRAGALHPRVERFVASQMVPAVFDQTRWTSPRGHAVPASGQIMKFDGFIRVYTEGRDEDAKDTEDDDSERRLPELVDGEVCGCTNCCPNSTSPAHRASTGDAHQRTRRKGDRTPSTYATIMNTILNKIRGRGQVASLASHVARSLVTDLLVDAFPDILTSSSPPAWRTSSTRSRTGRNSG